MANGPLVEDDDSTYINTMIPDEILEEILGWLLTKELLTSVSEVSTRFHKLAKQRDQFWQRKWNEILNQQQQQQQRRRSNRNDDDNGGDEHAHEPRIVDYLNQHQLQRCCWLLEHKIQASNYLTTTTTTSITAETTNNDDDGATMPVVDGSNRNPSSSSAADDAGPPSFLQHGSLLFSRLEAFRLLHDRENGVQRFLNLASSTDHHHESIENVLDEESRLRRHQGDPSVNWKEVRTDDRVSDVTVMESRQASLFSFRQPWWSSVPRNDPEIQESLAFCTRYPLTLVTEVAIKPYADWTMQTYSWKKMIVRVYNLSPLSPSVVVSDDNDDNDNGAERGCKTLCPSKISSSINSSIASSQSNVPDVRTCTQAFEYLESQTPVYESPLLDTPPPRNNAWQYHELPYGVVGNLITFTLVGKNFRQFEESGFYACVQRVAAQGIPVYESKEAANPDPSKVFTNTTPGIIPKRAMSMYRTSQVVPLLIR